MSINNTNGWNRRMWPATNNTMNSYKDTGSELDAKRAKMQYTANTPEHNYDVSGENMAALTQSDLDEFSKSMSTISDNVASLINVNSKLVESIKRIQKENYELKNSILRMESCITIMNTNIIMLAEIIKYNGIDVPNLQDPFNTSNVGNQSQNNSFYQ